MLKCKYFFSLEIKQISVNPVHNALVELRPCHLHEKGILRQKKNYGNSNMSVRPSVGTRDLRSL